ncbi:MAG: hypothetical protein LQ352_000901 [Teloschistes flavicans]|nr:MAG: hypothetical protein LQ352_000901 [Teloschistes flavicans]
MPPLAELSVNLPGKSKQASLAGTSTTTLSKGQSSKLISESHVSSLPTASAVQSMLKNTTELGDAGQFAVKATKTHRPRANTATHSRPHQREQFREQYDDQPTRSSSNQSRYYRAHREQHERLLYRNRSLRPYGGYPMIPNRPNHRSESFTQSSSTSRRVSVQPSLPMFYPYGSAGARPRSPFGYASRPGKPRYLPFSPPYSDFNRSDSALPSTAHRTYSARTTPPPSSSSNGKAPSNWYHSFNRSDPLLHRYQTVPISRRHDPNRSPPFSRRVSRASPPLASYRSSLASKSLAPHSSSSDLTSSRVPSPRPLFYDYSEAFEKESFRHTAQRSSMFIAPQIPQSDGSSEGYQTDVTSTSIPVTKKSTSSDESKAVTPERRTTKVKIPSPLRFVSQILRQETPQSNNASAQSNGTNQNVIIEPADQSIVIKSSSNEMGSSSEKPDPLSNRANMVDPFTKISSRGNQIKMPPSAYDPAPKVTKTASISMRLSSSSSGSHYSGSAHSRHDHSLDSTAIKQPQVIYERQPKALSVNFNRLGAIRHDALDSEPQQRAASLDARVRPESVQIFAPVPGRSMSSRDSRDRFSRILSIGEDFGKQGVFSNLLPIKKAPLTIQQYLRDKKSHSPKSIVPLDKELPSLPDNPPPVPDKGKGKAVTEPCGHDAVRQSFDSQHSRKQDADTFSIPGLEHLAALIGFGRPGIPLRYSSVSRNSNTDVPRLQHLAQASVIPQKPNNEEQPRRMAIAKRNSSLLQTMKELPSLPKDAVVLIPPPQTPSPPELPWAFVPMMSKEIMDTAVADMVDDPTLDAEVTNESDVSQQTPSWAIKSDLTFAPKISGSPASARPWNLDASYPWAGTPPKLEVHFPQVKQDSGTPIPSSSRFKFKIRQPSVLGTVGRLTKSRPPNLRVVHSPGASTQVTSVQAHFTEQLGKGKDGAPMLDLAPPSPGFHIEAQSFFSDDSSQKEVKGSLRKRLSQIRDRALAATASSENIKRGGHGNVANSGRSRAQLQGSKVNTKPSDRKLRSEVGGNRKLFERVKSWFQRHEEKIRKWHSRLSNKFHRNHGL